MAVAATNCRRESFFRDIWRPSLVSQFEKEIPFYFFPPGPAGAGPSRRYGISLQRSEQNCRRLSRNQALGGVELMLCSSWRQDEFFLFARELSTESEPGAGLTTNTALHTGPSPCAVKVCNSAAG